MYILQAVKKSSYSRCTVTSLAERRPKDRGLYVHGAIIGRYHRHQAIDIAAQGDEIYRTDVHIRVRLMIWKEKCEIQNVEIMKTVLVPMSSTAFVRK